MSYEQIKLPKPLTKKEVYTLYEKIKNGDQKARNEVIEHNILLVLKIAKKYEKYNEDSSDLVSIGSIGLIKGVDSFDISKNYEFATYAGRCIQNEILLHFRKENKRTLDINLDDVIREDKEGNSLKLEGVLEDENAQTDMHFAENQEILDAIRDFVSMLPALEKQIIEQRYDFKNSIVLTQQEVASKLGISRSYVSRIEKSAIEKLRIYLRDSNTLELNANLFTKKEKVISKRKRDYTSFYTYFFEYDNELLDQMLRKTTEHNRNIIHTIWGEELNNFNQEAYTQKVKNCLQSNISISFKKIAKKLKRVSENTSISEKNKDNILEQEKDKIEIGGGTKDFVSPIKKTKFKKDITTFYTYFGKYPREVMDEVLENTNKKYKKTIYTIWGKNLETLNKRALTSEVKKYLVYNISINLGRQAKILTEKRNAIYIDGRVKRDYTTFYTYFGKYDKEIMDEVLEHASEENKKIVKAIWGDSLEELNKETLTPKVKQNLIKSLTGNLEKQADKLIERKKKAFLDNRVKRDYTSFYTYFGEYDKKTLDEVLKRMNPKYKEKVLDTWGEDLQHYSQNLSSKDKKYLCHNVRSHVDAIVKRLQMNEESIQISFEEIEKSNKLLETSEKTQEVVEILPNNAKENKIEEITKEGYVALSEMIQTEKFQDLMKKVGKKEAFIIALKLEENSNEAIANFLEMPTEEVISTTKNILMQYKEQVLIEMEAKMDKAIDVITSNKIKMKKDTNKE